MESKLCKNVVFSIVLAMGLSNVANADDVESTQDSKVESKTDSKNATESKIYKLNAVTATDSGPFKLYSSGSQIGRDLLNSNPSGNGDITSILKILPNVKFNNNQLSSNTPGEIDPANISISGGLYYQNNFQLDGFNMNNDLDSIGNGTSGSGGASQGLMGGRSQGFNVDTSLLDSINVQDSNVSAAYGGFTGGVVEANIRQARKDKGMLGTWHANINYQHTSNYLTQYHIATSAEENFATSSTEAYQPYFSKHLIRASIEGYATKDLGIVASFSTTQSFIPLNSYSSNYIGGDVNSKRDQKRQSYNYYLKAHYNPLENLKIEANLGYMPQDNTYFIPIAKDSFYTMKSGGVQAGLKAIWDNPLGRWNNTLGYSFMQSSRRSDKNYYLTWQHSEGDKNWAKSSTNSVSEGGLSNIDQLQHTLNYKTNMQFNPIDIWKTSNIFNIGLEMQYQNVARNIRDNYYYGGGTVRSGSLANLNGATCQGDIFGLSLCSSAPTTSFTQANTTYQWNGQYIKTLNVIEANKMTFNFLSYGIFAEDDANFDFGIFGRLGMRFGVRLDGDTYMDKITFAPRFSMNYVAPWNNDYKTMLVFGANRYYGRNLFAYRLQDSILAATTIYSRTAIDAAWTTRNAAANSNLKFNQLNVPYDDEIMAGLTQNLWYFDITFKYIHREGKDEIMRRNGKTATGDNTTPDGYTNMYYIYTNDGRSTSDIITLSISNLKAIDTFGLKHHYLFAFDWSDTKRSYNYMVTTADETWITNPDILYNGQVIKYRDMPTDNYALPWSLRFNTTHTFSIWRTKWIWNNFFRIRSSYERVVRLARNSPGYDASFSGDQYGRYTFKTAFTWDMRLGFEVDVWNKNTLYVNVDIYNVLDNLNMTTLGNASGNAFPNVIGMTAAMNTPVYEIGRQFWLQVGYKF